MLESLLESLVERFVEDGLPVLEGLAERFVEEGLPILTGAAATAAGVVAAALAGYAVYKVTVKILDRTSIKEVIVRALARSKEKIGEKQLKAAVKELVDSKGDKAAHVKLDILDALDGRKQAEVQIEYEEIHDIRLGDVIENIHL